MHTACIYMHLQHTPTHARTYSTHTHIYILTTICMDAHIHAQSICAGQEAFLKASFIDKANHLNLYAIYIRVWYTWITIVHITLECLYWSTDTPAHANIYKIYYCYWIHIDSIHIDNRPQHAQTCTGNVKKAEYQRTKKINQGSRTHVFWRIWLNIN